MIDILEELCRKEFGMIAKLSFKHSQMILDDPDERIARRCGVRVWTVVHALRDRGEPAKYDRVRSQLESLVRKGSVVRTPHDRGGYTFYWPVDLSNRLRAE